MPPPLLLRGRLVDIASRLLDARLAVVTAPVGSGKSVLLAQWRDALQGRAAVAALHAEFAHNSAPVVRAAIGDALRNELPTLDWRLGDPITPTDFSDFARAAEAEARRDPALPLVIFIDGFEAITDPIVRDVFAAAIEFLPDDVHFVFASRSPLPFLVARLRNAGRLVEVEAHDLAFTVDETSDLARLLERNASPEEIVSRAGGWAVAVAMLLRDRHPERALRQVIDEEILPGLSPELYSFLLDSAALDRVTVDALDSIRETDDSLVLLQSLERRGAFPVPSAEPDVWVHPAIVRDHLLRLASVRDPDRTELLARRAVALAAGVSLSDRELQVLALLDSDLPIATIAHRLSISYHTVKSHVRSIYSKLDVGTRTAAVGAARGAGLLSD